jgi:hypothetical protein
LEKQDFAGALYDLSQAQYVMLQAQPVKADPMLRARDHIALSQYLLQNHRKDLMPAVLTSAEEALEETSEDSPYADAISRLKEDIQEMRKSVKRQEGAGGRNWITLFGFGQGNPS